MIALRNLYIKIKHYFIFKEPFSFVHFADIERWYREIPIS